jgi:hypothetical protein
MALTQVTTDGIADSAITQEKISSSVQLGSGGGSGGPKITQIQITNSSGTILDDTAVALGGGFIRITGTGFAAGAQVIVNNTPAVSTAFTSSTVLTAQVAAQSAGTYIVYVVNTDGGVALAVNGLTYSANPAWITSSGLNVINNAQVSIQLSASEATTYAIAAGSSLPPGLTLTSGGLLSGTISVATETIYSFTVNAIDAELQDSPRTFSITVTVGDPLFNLTTLLLPGNGANNTNNNTFLDSSTNNFTVTRSGNTTQGNFSPFSQTDWSYFFDGSGDSLTVSSNNFSTGGSWTIEAWCYFTNSSQTEALVNGPSSDRLYVQWLGTTLYVGDGSTNNIVVSNAKPINTWFHVAVVKNGGTYTAYINGINVGSSTTVLQTATLGNWEIGARSSQSVSSLGYISNLRITTNALYTANFTPPTQPLTAVAGTTLLTCQSNRFRDNSTNNFAITRNGDVRVEAFSPFNPRASYNAATIGGSSYFDGTGDFLSVSGGSALNFDTGNFTVECWIYFANDLTNAECTFFAGTGTGNADLSYNEGSFRFGRANVAWDTTISHVLARRAWHHVAFTKESGVAKVYVNGILIGSGANTQSYNAANARINAAADTSRQLIGYMSGLRVVKGTAVYTANFTPPTAPPTAIANTSLLLNFTNDPIADATSKNVVETVGNVAISTAQSKWGGSSINFPSTESWLKLPDSDTGVFRTGDFTIEMWVFFPENLASSGRLIAFTSAASATAGRLQQGSGNSLQWTDASNLPGFGTGANISVSLNTWTHVAVCRSGTTLRYFKDGVQVASGTDSNNYIVRSISVGADHAGNNRLTCSINDLRITRGHARYTANFIPPVSAFSLNGIN